MPLIFATGAGASSRISLGTAVVFGMAVNTLFIPNFYHLMQSIHEKFQKKRVVQENTPEEDDAKKV